MRKSDKDDTEGVQDDGDDDRDCVDRSDGGEDDRIVQKKIEEREQDEVIGLVDRECGEQDDGGRDGDGERDDEMRFVAGRGNAGLVIEMVMIMKGMVGEMKMSRKLEGVQQETAKMHTMNNEQEKFMKVVRKEQEQTMCMQLMEREMGRKQNLRRMKEKFERSLRDVRKARGKYMKETGMLMKMLEKEQTRKKIFGRRLGRKRMEDEVVEDVIDKRTGVQRLLLHL